MSRNLRCYWFEVTSVAVGLMTAAAILPHGREAVFSVGALTAAALSSSAFRQSLTRA